MRFSADCVPCLLNRVVYETDLVAPERREEAMEAALHEINNGFSGRENSAKLATRVHRMVYDIIGDPDPYLDLKERSNEAARSVLPAAKRFIDGSEDRLKAACQVAIAGNVMDFGIDVGLDGPEGFGRKFQEILAEGLQVDDVDRLRSHASRAKNIIFLTDNSGEIVLDQFLVRELQALGAKVTGVVKGEAIITDATEKDLHETGMDGIFDEWTTTGMFAIGVDLDRSPPLRNMLGKADLVVSKGMANFEALSDDGLKNVAYLLRAKCRPVAESIGAKKDDNVVRVIENA
ncbi:MAG: hypothetical protein A4E32_00246 [Methanomassiliicoccales archaeon PtaU1.Bin124]|nr:MAG: hypothetical protein A4E32_00246 [Methanomassiliicoccales archaeon PtaU1.Bin124]